MTRIESYQNRVAIAEAETSTMLQAIQMTTPGPGDLFVSDDDNEVYKTSPLYPVWCNYKARFKIAQNDLAALINEE